MSQSTQILHVHYQGSTIQILDTDDHTLLSTMRAKPFKFFLHRGAGTAEASCNASFSLISTVVNLVLHSRPVRLEREKKLTRTYQFLSSGDGGLDESNREMMFWRADGALSGDFKLVDKRGEVKARFRNKLFSNSELGSFEIVGGGGGGGGGAGGQASREEEEERQTRWREEVVMTGLATLAMVQSGCLGVMVCVGKKI